MEHQRFNIFNLIHKALRNMLYDTALKIQRSDFSLVEETLPVVMQMEQLLLFFDKHARHEEVFILPVINRFDSKMVREFESQHLERNYLIEDLRAFSTQWKLETQNSPRVLWGQKIFYSFNRFVAFNLNHTNKAERLLNPVLWQNYSDVELHAISQKLIQSMKPEELLAQSRWIMRSINQAELISWLGGIRQSAPAEVFNELVQMAQEELSEGLWLEVKTSLVKESLTV